MTTHLASRLVWNDRGWDGRICDDPSQNTFCTGHERIRDEKRVDQEESIRGELPWDGKYLPPCTWDINAFSEMPACHTHKHPFIRPSQLAPVPEGIPPYTIGTWPYDLMYDESGQVRPLRQREEYVRNFFDALESKNSLVFMYVTQHNPISRERPERTGDQVLVGISRFLDVSDQLRYDSNDNESLRDFEVLWSRMVTHNYPEEGVRIPYQEYLRTGKDVERIAVAIPQDMNYTFKFVGRHVTDDQACTLVEKVIDAIGQVQQDGFVKADWTYRLDWLNQALAEVWQGRGAYPGIGAALEYLDFGQGTTYLRQELAPRFQEDREDLVAYIRACLDGEREIEEPAYRDEMQKARKKWRRTRAEKRDLLLRLCSFELSRDQVLRILDDQERPKYNLSAAVEDITDNPYLLCEEYRGAEGSDSIGFDRIDNGLFPSPSLGIDPEIENDDDRRVRALIVEQLGNEAADGHVFAEANGVLEAIRQRCAEGRACEVDLDFITADPEIRAFHEEKVVVREAEGATYFYLRSLSDLETETRDRVEDMLQRSPREASGHPWREKIAKDYHPDHFSPDKLEQTRDEQSRALENCYRHGFSVITGAAGTGKSSLVKLLVRGIQEIDGHTDFLIMAPTGKASVRLQKEDLPAETIHRALMRTGWINPTNFTLRSQPEERLHATNIVVDEASMIDVELMGTLFRAIDWDRVKRLILVGDPNQLPPIGPGRPFYDIITYLKQDESYQDNLNGLVVNCRLIEQDSSSLILASSFAQPEPSEEEILRQTAQGGSIGSDLEVIYWHDDTDLHDQLMSRLNQLLEAEFGAKFAGQKDYEWFNRLLGIDAEGTDGHSAEYFQILAPVRGYFFGTREMNRVLQTTFRRGLIVRVGAIGPENITSCDKVIQTANDRRYARVAGESEKRYVFNGEIGIVTACWDKRRRRGSAKNLVVRFEDEPGAEFSYNRMHVGEYLELAYALTVHKAQGSQFQWVFFILSKEAANLSRELLYTALTRSRKRLVLFVQDDVGPLLDRRRLESASIIRRNTSLFTFQPVEMDQPFRENGLIHVAKDGQPMRSKSEVIIANELISRDISFDYEEPLHGTDGDPHNFRLPDFTLYRAGDAYYWEHLGMLSDPDYRRRWDLKKRWYDANGYADRLIITEDDEQGGLDSRIVVERVNAWIEEGQ